jgi:hypothetical protein
MNYPIVCEFCGSGRLRRSHWHSKTEMAQSTLGTYPFRCQDCNARFLVNVFLLSRLAYAKCPKCLSLDISNSRNIHRPGFFKKMILTFGGRRCRCNNCRYMFISFRPFADLQLGERELEQQLRMQAGVAITSEPKIQA